MNLFFRIVINRHLSRIRKNISSSYIERKTKKSCATIISTIVSSNNNRPGSNIGGNGERYVPKRKKN